MSFFRNWFYLYMRQTAAEIVFENLISKLGEPYRAQFPFPGLKRVADFALHTRKVVIEVDGASHLVTEQRRKDITTSIALEERGWRVIRFTNAEVFQIQSPVELRELIEVRLSTRPTLEGLRLALRQLPEPPVRVSKPRARKPKLGPKSVHSRSYRKKKPAENN